jgi:exodeoxyribonuclease VII large subunit
MSNTPESISLFELNNQVKNGIRELFPGNYWIVGEISEMNTNQSGHCYLELIEKKQDSEQILARAKATIWAYTFRMLRPYFESVTGQHLVTGIKVLVQVSIEFHEVYGYSLNIKDIEPNFTLGDLTRKRQEIIKQLQEEGVFHLNKELELPLVPQRIAVISSETAAGYGDFVDQLTKNRKGYSFYIQLYNAFMQGNEAEQSIIEALEKIFQSVDNFDLVVIIRGGGSQMDLNCFNSYWLCYHITQFPLPVLTGIGHERDETIADLVAHTSLKTPTAVAEFIIEKVSGFDEQLDEMHERLLSVAIGQLDSWKEETTKNLQRIVSLVKIHLGSEKQKMKSLGAISINSLKTYLQRNRRHLSTVPGQIKSSLHHFLSHRLQYIRQTQKSTGIRAKSIVKEESQRLHQFETANHLLDPVHVLKRGYTLTFRDGKLIKTSTRAKPGDILTTKWFDGTVQSTVDPKLEES